ncbi:hypothetical protein GCM10010174_29210 [Kutzneria viridogrisea]|uniref:Uncharacterized protein n=1 Tax=Kutzneria viridogrisea TaxID=47990 RepID=A0ABR6BCG5_9PSEU|nr:hypothetical protein [Kutzneria viridogrisea]
MTALREPRAAPHADLVRTAPEVFSDCVAAITARLAARHDRLSVLDAVITAYGDLLARPSRGP